MNLILRNGLIQCINDFMCSLMSQCKVAYIRTLVLNGLQLCELVSQLVNLAARRVYAP